MKLHWSPKSPFVRKVLITLHETGLIDQVECVRSVADPTQPPNPQIVRDNPIGKIPTLVTDEGETLFDSRVICEYLDLSSGVGLIPSDLGQRMQQLRWQALADGMMDVLLLWRIELNVYGEPHATLIANWQPKIQVGMARLEAEVDALRTAPFGIGQISLVCLLGHMDFRWAGANWRQRFPGLAAFYAELQKRPSVMATPVVDEGSDGSKLTEGRLAF